jgi:hypothetical protein
VLLAATYFYSEIVLFGLLVLYLTYSTWYNLVPAVRRWEDSTPAHREGAAAAAESPGLP